MAVPLLGKRCEMSDSAADATGDNATTEDEVFIAKNCISSAKRQRYCSHILIFNVNFEALLFKFRERLSYLLQDLEL